MRFFLIGLNHKTCPVELRENLSFNSQDIEKFIISKKSDLEAEELCALSTCNRTEFYGTHEHSHIIKQNMKKAVLDFKNVDLGLMPKEMFYYYEDDTAVRHLFEVASGIDSMVVGETQILGQVKDAYSISTKVGSNGPMINKIFHQAIRVGKRARTETKISEGILSISHAAVELSKKIFSEIKNKSVLLVGAGETGEIALNHFKKEGVKKIWISNRSLDRARDLSVKIGGSVVSFDDFKTVLGKVDIAIFSTSAEKYILSRDDSSFISSAHKIDPLFLMDISVPRNVDPGITETPNIFLYDIDDLEGIVSENMKIREAEVVKVNKIISEEIFKFRQWMGNLQFEPLLKLIKTELENIKNSELKGVKSRLGDKFEDVEELTRRIINKIANRPFQKLKRFNVNTHNYILRASLVEELFKEGYDD